MHLKGLIRLMGLSCGHFEASFGLAGSWLGLVGLMGPSWGHLRASFGLSGSQTNYGKATENRQKCISQFCRFSVTFLSFFLALDKLWLGFGWAHGAILGIFSYWYLVSWQAATERGEGH